MAELVPSEAPEGALTRAALALSEQARLLGSMALLFASICGAALRRELDGLEFIRNLHRMGVKSLPIVATTALFTGGIMVIQAGPLVERYGAQGLLGWGAGFGTLREIGPLLTALMISGRVGANNTAELGTMAVTEQLDALRALAIDPQGYLVAPRFFGIVLTLLLSTVFSDALALFGASQAGWALLGVEPTVFFQGLTSELLGFGDVLHGLIKSVLFGGIIGLCSCHFGISTAGGAPGVGRAVNATVVTSAVGIFACDYLSSFALG
ncbi:MAG TPA: ABC transporter permease [Polyangiaceae bacterium]|nr:ABC transporter permease [Polyangiaceae bacterium]